MKIINYKKKELIPLTDREHESYASQEKYDICRKKIEDKYTIDEKYCKFRYHQYYAVKQRGRAHHRVWNSKYSLPNKTSIIFHNGSNYKHIVIIKELPNRFDRKFDCLTENGKKNIHFSIQIKKEVKRIGKEEKKLNQYGNLHRKVY